jgi:hypothetical protein
MVGVHRSSRCKRTTFNAQFWAVTGSTRLTGAVELSLAAERFNT